MIFRDGMLQVGRQGYRILEQKQYSLNVINISNHLVNILYSLIDHSYLYNISKYTTGIVEITK